MKKNKYLQCSLLLALFIALPGCASNGGYARSYHDIKEFNPETGKLVRHERKEDKSKIGAVNVAASKELSAFNHTRTNTLTGANSTTSVGAITDKPSPETLQALGEAVGKVVGEVVKKTANPVP